MIGGLFSSASRLALIAAAGVIAGGVTSAQAADLGGNCCADLEERVAELEATTARKGNRRVSLTIAGQVNKAIVWHDSDAADAYRSGKATVRDNDAGMSRFRFSGDAKISADLTAGYVLTVGVYEDFGTGTQGTDSSDFGTFLIRENFGFIRSASMGTLRYGQTSQTTDGLIEINLANAQVTPVGNDESFRMLGANFDAVFGTPFDGARRQGLQYVSPTFAGFSLGAGWSHGTQNDPTEGTTDTVDVWEIALRYAGEFGGFKVAGGIGYRNEDATFSDSDADVYLGSASIMHVSTGLFVSGGYGSYKTDGFASTVVGASTSDREAWWVMAGIEQKFIPLGATTIFGEYAEMSGLAATGAAVPVVSSLDGTYYGLGVVQKIDAAAMDIYLNYRNYEIDATGESADVIVGGAIIRF